MAAKPLDPAIAEAVVTDWRVGQMSQRQLAEKHSISLGMVSKLCKGVRQDAVSIVNAGIEYRQALAAHDERIVNAVEKVVDERIKRDGWHDHRILVISPDDPRLDWVQKKFVENLAKFLFFGDKND